MVPFVWHHWMTAQFVVFARSDQVGHAFFFVIEQRKFLSGGLESTII
jgi:hypothetical protein